MTTDLSAIPYTEADVRRAIERLPNLSDWQQARLRLLLSDIQNPGCEHKGSLARQLMLGINVALR